ncbi:MAG: BREX system P-loop protein BrxC [Thermomicrobiales bacterium]
MLIRETLDRDLALRIEEIIKLDQQDEAVVHQEITEYVPTKDIVRAYTDLLDAMIRARTEPTEGIGVWISGFFGSGKSSFAKNLGYMLSNRTVLGEHAGPLLARQLNDPGVSALIDVANHNLPTTVMMFDVMLDRAIRRQGNQPIAELVYTVVLRELDYAEDPALADLEFELEGAGRLAAFEARIAELFGDDVPERHRQDPSAVWRYVRKASSNYARASRVLHEIDPTTYSTADTFLQSVKARAADVSIREVVDRTFEMMARRRLGHGLAIIIDEVGQYVGRSAEKIEDLRSLVEHFGQEGRNRVKDKRASGQVWIFVTSQEKLDEVVAAIDSRRVELAKLQDRFRHHVDLAPADIKTVATKRVLGKNAAGDALLRERFAESEGQLATHTKLERTSRFAPPREGEFVQFYPYLPHFIDLSIDIVSGMRLQPGAPKHIGGSNRTIIKQAYEMLVSPRTDLANAPVGALVTLDRIYELVEGNLSTEKRKDIGDIAERLPDGGWPERVAKTIALLEFVRDLPRTERNIAALLYDRLGQEAVLGPVQGALDRLREAQFIRLTDEGYKLQTQQEKSWETERNGIDPTGKERHDLLRDTVRKIAEARIRPYQHKQGRAFRIDLSIDGVSLAGQGHIPIALILADDAAHARELADLAAVESRQASRENRIEWIATLTPGIFDLQTSVLRSRRMIAKYEQARAQGQMPPQDAALLAEERQRMGHDEARLQEQVATAIAHGAAIFRGVTAELATQGATLEAGLRALLDDVVPRLYPKLELGAKAVKGTEAEEILKAANLNALSQVFYDGPGGLGLVTADSANRRMINDGAEIAQEVLRYLQQQHAYGEKVTGKVLEQHFTGLPYGWDPEVVRVVLATLLRGASVEVTHQGRRYRNHLDPLARTPFAGPQPFRAASFAPRTKVGMADLVTAANSLEAMTGDEVDVEEEAIASAVKALAQQEQQDLLPVEARLDAHAFPRPEVLREYRETLSEILAAAPDDCVRILAGEGATLRDQRQRVRAIRDATAEAPLSRMLDARDALRELWPLVQGASAGSELYDDVARAAAALDQGTVFDHLDLVTHAGARIRAAYAADYREAHAARTERYREAIATLRARPEWEQLTPPADAPVEVVEQAAALREQVLGELKRRVCDDGAPGPRTHRCERCGAGLRQLAADLEVADLLLARALEQLRLAVLPPDPDPERPSQRLRIVDLAPGPISDDDELEAFLDQLRGSIGALLATGARVIVE